MQVFSIHEPTIMDANVNQPTDDEILNSTIEQATELLSRMSIPLYIDKGSRPLFFGTGFIVKTQGRFFLVSAAHVLDAGAEHSIFFYCAPNTIRFLTGEAITTKIENDRSNDLLDIGITELRGSHLPPYPEVDKFAIDISYLRPTHLPRAAKIYSLIGFPATKVSLDVRERTVTVAPFCFRNRSVAETDYASHGLDPGTHLVLALDVKNVFSSDGSRIQFPKPQGMSGSPVFVLYDHGPDSDESSFFQLVAVATSYRSRDRILFGTDVSFVLGAIDAAMQKSQSE